MSEPGVTGAAESGSRISAGRDGGGVRQAVLLILDGWGHREEVEHNALAQADLPNWRRLWANAPRTLIHTEGRHVGLPDGQMGNSEVGHMNLGAGRIVYQELTRIDAAIESGEFFANPGLLRACDAAITAGGTLHLIGLLSPGGVHSHERHLFAMLELTKRRGVPRVAVHALLDGRDMPPRSAEPSLAALQQHCLALGNARIASIGGRYYAMDRDGRWERVHRAWEAIVESRGDYRATDAHSALLAAYARGENDEFVAPTVIEGAGQVTGGDASIDRPRICGKMQDGDTVVFMNFRADRARQLTAAFVASDFSGFIARRPALSRFVGLTQYDARLPAEVAFASDDLRHSIGELVSDLGLRQLRIAETEKYAHVTFFFSGGREAPFAGEDRVLVPSPRVATYDLAPEMSCPEVTARLCEAIRRDTYALLVCNLANADMVGHTGNMTAAIRAVETIDAALGEIEAAVHAAGAALLITADHGNIEQMHDAIGGQAHTAHTVGPVPLVCVGVGDVSLRGGGALRDVAPTLLQLLRLPQPPEMSGRSLFETV